MMNCTSRFRPEVVHLLTTPVTGHPYIHQVDTIHKPGVSDLRRTSVRMLDQFGNPAWADEWDYTQTASTRKHYTYTYLTDSNYSKSVDRSEVADRG